MIDPPIPSNETERLAALYKLNLIDTPPEERFDSITEQARHYFDVKYAFFTLVDKDWVWHKSYQNNIKRCERTSSFCAHAIIYDEPMYVPDARQDERFSDNPVVIGEPGIRFYAGAQVKNCEGLNVGILCVFDTEPKSLLDNDFAMLKQMASMVEDELAATAA